MLARMGRNWSLIAVRGVMAILLGILIFLDPSIVLTFIAVFAIVDGVFGILQAFQHRGESQWGWMLLEGVIGVILGIVIILYPVGAALAVTWIIGAWAISTGVVEILLAFRLRKEIQGEFWLGLAGVLSIAFGVVAILFPLSTFVTLSWLIATYAIIFGMMLVFLAFRVRSEYNRSIAGSTADDSSTNATTPSRTTI